MADIPDASTSEDDTSLDISQHKETVRLICRIDQKIKKNQDLLNAVRSSQGKKTNYMQIASKLTGLTTLSLESIQALKTPITSIYSVDRSVVLTSYSLHCLQVRQLPSTKRMYLNLKKKLPMYMDITSFRKMLFEMDFIWRRKASGLVIIENPKVSFERFRYLKKLKKYTGSLPVYYVDENYMFYRGSIIHKWVSAYNTSECQVQENNYKCKSGVLYALSKEGIHAVSYVNDINEVTFETWIVDTLIPTLQEPSVVIMNNAHHHCKIVNVRPTLNSLKAEIREFLDFNNVPYDIDMSKYELYGLSQKLAKVKTNIYVVDSILRNKGHQVLRLPSHIGNLTPASILNEFMKGDIEKSNPRPLEEKVVQNMLNEMFESIGGELYKCFDSINEGIGSLYKNDVIMDQIWDEVVANSLGSLSELYEDSEVTLTSDDDA